MAQNLEKATIKILAGSRKDDVLTALFNPAEYSHDIKNNFQEASLPGLGNPVVQFVNGESQSLSMDLFFDSWTDEGGTDVSETTRLFARTLAIDSDLHAPPPVLFSWGAFRFKAVIEALSQRFTMFTADGLPVRATLSVTFKQYRPISEQLEDPRLNSSDKTKRRVLTGDTSLWAIAAREYGHPREWRRIALKNRIANPRGLAAGDVLLLPPLEDDDASRVT